MHDNILKKFEFERSRAKVKVTVAFFRKTLIALVPSLIIQFQFNFTQVLDMTIPRTSLHFSLIGSWSRSQWLFLEKLSSGFKGNKLLLVHLFL